MNTKILSSIPVDKKAAVISGQQDCADTVYLDSKSLGDLKNRLLNKQTRIKRELGIANKSQVKNVRHRINRRKSSSELEMELKLIGEEIFKVQCEMRRHRLSSHFRRNWQSVYGWYYIGSLFFGLNHCRCTE